MLKRLTVAVAALFVLATSAFAAGTVPGFSLVPQFDKQLKAAAGCYLYVIQAGTVAAPQNAYQDSGLTLLQPNPMRCDATARLPQWFTADGNVKLRLTDKNGVELFAQDNLLVIGASSGGGGGGSVDPTTILATGDMKLVYGTGVLTGFVRCNARTMGNATSGGTERANADTSALFVSLWNNDANLTVSGGRGVSAAADYAANKTITLPDCRGRLISGLDDMGNTAAGRRTVTYTGVAATVLGSVATTTESFTLGPSHIPSNLTFDTHFTALPNQYGPTTILPNVASTSGIGVWASPTSTTTQQTIATGGTLSTTTVNAGGNPHAIVDPTIFMTFYIKL